MSEETPPETEVPPVGEEESVMMEEDPASSNMMIYILLLAALGGAAYYFLVVKKAKKEETRGKDVDVDEAMSTNTVGLQDISYIASKLGPNSGHLDVLLAVASTPESIAYGLRSYKNREKLRQERIAQDKEDAKANKTQNKETPADKMFDFDDDGWADDDDDDEKAKLAAKAEEEKKKEREQLQKAVGKAKALLEELDEGVIGQKWVEKTLSSNNVWPPKDLGFLAKEKFDYEGKQVSAMDHPGLRRNLCMIFGRLNSTLLNSHPELLEAGSKQLVDQTYFKASMEFRGRCALLLEAALRTAVACRSHPLTKTIVETVGMFKIGCPSVDKVDWFNGVMQKQYQCLPRLQIANTKMECAGEPDMATGDVLLIGLELTRLHAESFTRQKIAMFQKQGIPPQVALQTYREGWWFLVHAERLDGETPGDALDLKTDGLLKDVAKKDLEKFHAAKFEERLMTAWPMVVQNVAQKSGNVKIQFAAPPVPGKYKFTVSVKSQDFLGADQEFSVEGTILDASEVTRKPKKAEGDETKEEAAKPEAKKDN